ncbi:MAG: cytochrome c [Gemmatimonadaceae bacterium]|nr:cytochrome c [Gemmatimonadaceae bacterium]
MRIRTILCRAILVVGTVAALPAAAQEHPARRVANIVSVAVEEYGKAVDATGRLVSTQEYQEANDFLIDAKRAAERLSGATAGPARLLLDSIARAVTLRRSPATLDSLERRFANVLGNEARLELPRRQIDLAEGRTIFQQSCATCHGVTGRGDGSAAARMNPRPPAIGTADHMRGITPALMFRITSIGIAGTPMAGFAGTLTPDQRWNVVAYVNTLRTTREQQLEGEGLFTQRCASCHGVSGAGDGTLARSLTKLPPEIGTVAWQVEHSDEQVALVVREGMPGTALPA